MDPVEGWITLIAFGITSSILLYAITFDQQPEPTMGWWCLGCKKQGIGMRSEMEKAGWTVDEKALYCPKCKTTI